MPEWLNKFAKFGQGANPFLSFITGLGSGLFNFFSSKNANDTNLQIARETNAANAEQAELAYHRSLPVNQVSNLISAGMSKQGALSALTGGGQYTAPVMQGASVSPNNLDLSGVMAAFDRLGSLSSNVEQQRILKAQRHDLEVTTQNKENAEKRAAELHEYDLWSRRYGKETATKLDAAENLLLNSLLDSGKEIKDFSSYESLVRGLNLQDKSELRDLPSVARQNLFTSVRDKFNEARSQAAEGRAIETQNNANRAAEDSHKIAVATLTKIRDEHNDWKKHQGERDAESQLAEQRAKHLKMLEEQGFATDEYKRVLEFYRGDDGKLHPRWNKRASDWMKQQWNEIAKVVGLDYLVDILKGIITIAPK